MDEENTPDSGIVTLTKVELRLILKEQGVVPLTSV